MRKLFLIIIAFIAVVTFIQAVGTADNPSSVSRGASELIETN
jgi:hypothetical protein